VWPFFRPSSTSACSAVSCRTKSRCKNLALTVGTKLEHNDYTGTEWEPGLRLQWQPAATRMFWGAVSRAVRTPSRVDRDISQAAPPICGPPRRREFRHRNRAGLPNWVSARNPARSSPPASRCSTTATTTCAAPVSRRHHPAVLLRQQPRGGTHGLELTADYQLTTWWRLHASYDLLREHLHVKPGQSDLNNTRNETADPKQQFSLRAALDLPHRVEFDADWRWVDSLAINNGGAAATVPAYCELDVRLGWHPSEAIELSLAGQNLLHAQHPEYGAPGPTREEIKRSVYAKVTWRF